MKASRPLLGVAAFAMICATTFVHAQGESREKVKAETAAAKKAGAIPQGEAPSPQPAVDSTKTRADRKAETKSAKARGEVDQGGEANPSDGKTKTTGESRKRSDVKAEAAQAAKAGKVTSGER